MEQSSPGLEGLARAWTDRAGAHDVDGLLDLYDAQAVVAAFREVVEGRDELSDRLQTMRHHLRKLKVQAIETPQRTEGGIRFDTLIAGRLGRMRLRHLLNVRDGLICGHEVTLVSWEKGGDAASLAS